MLYTACLALHTHTLTDNTLRATQTYIHSHTHSGCVVTAHCTGFARTLSLVSHIQCKLAHLHVWSHATTLHIFAGLVHLCRRVDSSFMCIVCVSDRIRARRRDQSGQVNSDVGNREQVVNSDQYNTSLASRRNECICHNYVQESVRLLIFIYKLT